VIESWRDVLVLALCVVNGCVTVPALMTYWRDRDEGLGVLLGVLVALEPYLLWLYVRLAWHL
jgi:hypothetical protein